MNVAAIAAFVAAGISFINVLISVLVTLRGQRVQWRREAERSVVARLLNSSDRCMSAWKESAKRQQEWVKEGRPENSELRGEAIRLWNDGEELRKEMALAGAELELLASSGLRRAVAALLGKYEVIRKLADGQPYDISQHREDMVYYERSAVISWARSDIGTERWELNLGG